jgi:hypothetical protein
LASGEPSRVKTRGAVSQSIIGAKFRYRLPWFLLSWALTLLLQLPAAARMCYVTESGTGEHNGQSAESSWSRTEFNNPENWAETPGDASKISPGDTVNVIGTLAGSMKCAGNGIADQVITIAFDSAARAVNGFTFTFNGKSYLRLTDLHLADHFGTGPRNPVVSFSGKSAAVSAHCQIDHMYSKGKRGSGFIQVGHCTHVTISDCTFVDFFGMGVTMSDSPVDHVVIENNIFETVNTFADPSTPAYLIGPGQNDILHLAWATNVLIKGNRMILRGSVTPGTPPRSLPHNDVIQAYHNPLNPAQKPTDWTIANNWIEISGAKNGAGYNNFGMLQWIAGRWLIYGNFCYSHDLSSTVSNGFDLEQRDAAAATSVKLYHNTFVSLRTGLSTQILSRPGHDRADKDRLEVVNNLFYSDQPLHQPILQGISNEPNGLFLMRRNLLCGWKQAVRNVYEQQTRRSTNLNFAQAKRNRGRADVEAAKTTTPAELGFVSTVAGREDFALTTNSAARGSGSALADKLLLPTAATRTAFPYVNLTPATARPHIGAWQTSTDTSGSPVGGFEAQDRCDLQLLDVK